MQDAVLDIGFLVGFHSFSIPACPLAIVIFVRWDARVR